MKARLYTDGGARGNPGPAAFAYVLEAEDGTVLAAHGEAIGVATNNVAEYRALVEGLRKASELQLTDVEVVSDSELLVRQMQGDYKVKRARRPARERGARREWVVETPGYTGCLADVAQLVERLLAMQKVVGSSPIIRSLS